jgi:NAD(P)-dependent dehydrogenase (short-subunit alcohol dehydrogenase family)
MRLSGKTILITGGASGIGAATAQKCEAEGGRVIVFDRPQGDVSDEARVRAFFEAIPGPIDALVNSAGIAVRKTVLEQDEESWDRVMAVNVKGCYLSSQYAVPKMQAAGGGAIVHLSSVVGLTGVRNRAAYSTSKGAIVALTRNMAMDLAGRRIRVNCVCPGFTRTPFTAQLLSDPEKEAKLLALHPLGRLGEPADIANAIAFLVSDEASWITGQAIAVDGGFTAGYSVDV